MAVSTPNHNDELEMAESTPAHPKVNHERHEVRKKFSNPQPRIH